MKRTGSRGGIPTPLIVIVVIAVAVAGAMFYFAGKAENSLPAPEEVRIEVDNVL